MHKIKLHINSLVELLIPQNLKHKPEVYWRAKLYVYVSLFLLSFIMIGATIEQLVDTQNSFPISLAFFACFCFIFLLKITRSLKQSTNILISITYLILINQCIKSGGIYSLDYTGSIMCPLLAFVLSDKKSGIFWSIIYVLTGTFLVYLEYHAPQSYLYQMQDFRLSYFFVNNAFYFLIVNIGIVHIYISVQNYVIKLLEEQRKTAEKQRLKLEQQKVQLDKTSKELEESNKDLEAYAYVVSHDLKQPLRTVHGFTQLLERSLKGNDDPQIQECLQYILGGTQEMQAMVSDLLKYAKLSQGNGQFNYQKLSVQLILDIVQQHLTQQIQDTKAQIQILYLPTEIIGIRSHLVQLFQNLISNAIKFHHPDRPPIVSISCEATITHWEFSVQDNGIGIPAKATEEVFDVFRRLHRKDEYAGTGIGLAVCKKIVETHGGLIRLESKEGVGTCFYFSIAKNLQAQVPILSEE